MFENLKERRYPWESTIDFISDGYWAELAALHLSLGLLFILFFAVKILFLSKIGSIELKLSIVYFSLIIFNNPAYSLYGVNFGEICGILALVAVVAKINITKKIINTTALGLLLAFVFSLTHSLFALLIYPELISSFNLMILKLAVNFKILVLAVNIGIFCFQTKNYEFLALFARACVTAGTFALLMYSLQIIVFLFGILPYGTYIDAGFIGLPSFGSVSIERGHFGKFLAPYFPFFLFLFLANGAWLRFLLYCFVSIINFSASSQFFFVCSIFIAIILFYKKIDLKMYFYITLLTVPFFLFVLINIEIFNAIIDKIYTIAFLGDESQSGGRSFGLFLEYLNSHPFGLGYGGSTFRAAPSLPEINASYFAFITQYSILAIPLFLGYLYLILKSLGRSLGGNLLFRCMSVGTIMSAFIFAVDILWFVPLIWLTIAIGFMSTKYSVGEPVH